MTERRRIFRFAIVGTGVAVYYIAAYLGLLHLLGSPWVANFLAFGSAILIQYVGQTAWTFGKPLAVPAQFGRFLCMIGIGLAVSSAITGVAGPRLGFTEPMSAAVVVVVLPILKFVEMPIPWIRWITIRRCKPQTKWYCRNKSGSLDCTENIVGRNQVFQYLECGYEIRILSQRSGNLFQVSFRVCDLVSCKLHPPTEFIRSAQVKNSCWWRGCGMQKFQ